MLSGFTLRQIGLAALSAAGLVLLAWLAINFIERQMHAEKINLVRSQTQTVLSLIAQEERAARQGRVSVEQAKASIIRMIHALRYGAEDYFFIYDSAGTCIAHGSKPEREGRNFLDAPDAVGHVYYPEMIAKAKSGGGEVSYWFPRLGSDRPVPKISYALYFEPWDWIIGTGVYVDDIEEAQKSATKTFALVVIAILALVLIAAVFLARSVVKPVLELAAATHKISSGDYKADIPGLERKDEIGTLSKALLTLRRSSQDMDSFARIAAHDLQEPLRQIVIQLQLLRKRYGDKLDDEADSFIDFAVSGAYRLQEMINGVLLYLSLSTSDVPLELVGAEACLADALGLLDRSLQEKNALVTNSHLPTLVTKKMLLSRLFYHLIDNALKFSKPGEAPAIHVSAKRKGKEIVFSVTDNGIGIEQAFLDRIFVMFQKLHVAEKYKGVGVGLTIAKKIVEKLGGRIWVESTPEIGSTFRFALPVMEARKNEAVR